MRSGKVPDMDVCDAATWSVAGPLSGASVAAGSNAVEVPDFSRGGWKAEDQGTFAE